MKKKKTVFSFVFVLVAVLFVSIAIYTNAQGKKNSKATVEYEVDVQKSQEDSCCSE